MQKLYNMTITPININRNVDLIEARVMILGFNIYMIVYMFFQLSSCN